MIMNEKRMQECFVKLLGYILDQNTTEEELFGILHDKAGFKLEELHEYGINRADRLYKQKVPRDLLSTKVGRCYQVYRQKWEQMTQGQLIDAHNELYAVSVVYPWLCQGVPEDQARWLLRFKNPLMVVSDYWLQVNDAKTFDFQDDLHALIEKLKDVGDADIMYEQEDVTLL